MEVLDHGIQVEALEFLGVVERLAHRIGQGGVLVENLKVQLVRPPVAVRSVAVPPVNGHLLSLVMFSLLIGRLPPRDPEGFAPPSAGPG